MAEDTDNKTKKWRRTKISLSAVFGLASIYLFPIAFKKKPGQKLPRLDTTNTLAKMVLAIMMNIIAAPFLTLTLPRAEDYLRDNDMDPALAQTLAGDKTVRIIPRNLWGTFYTASMIPSLPGALWASKKFGSPECNAYSTKYNVLPLVWRQALIMPLGEHCFTKNYAYFNYNLSLSTANFLPAFDNDLKKYVFLHELAHLHEKNDAARAVWDDNETHQDIITLAAETEADVRSLQAVYNEKLEALKIASYLRAMDIFSPNHDTSLYLDALVHNQTPPNIIEMVIAQTNAVSRILSTALNDDNLATHEKLITVVRKVLDNPENRNMDPLTKRRLELYVEAVEYLMPETRIETTPKNVEPRTTIPAPPPLNFRTPGV